MGSTPAKITVWRQIPGVTLGAHVGDTSTCIREGEILDLGDDDKDYLSIPG